jgi:DNA-binding PadR family transcriptional regulator
MQEPTFLILTALAAGAQHGYGIMTDVRRISDGRVRLRAGTLYAALDRLRGDGLVEGDKEEVVDGRLRRYYRITPEGTLQLAAEVEHMRANVAAASFRLGLALVAGCRWRQRHPLAGSLAPTAC